MSCKCASVIRSQLDDCNVICTGEIQQKTNSQCYYSILYRDDALDSVSQIGRHLFLNKSDVYFVMISWSETEFSRISFYSKSTTTPPQKKAAESIAFLYNDKREQLFCACRSLFVISVCGRYFFFHSYFFVCVIRDCCGHDNVYRIICSSFVNITCYSFDYKPSDHS